MFGAGTGQGMPRPMRLHHDDVLRLSQNASLSAGTGHLMPASGIVPSGPLGGANGAAIMGNGGTNPLLGPGAGLRLVPPLIFRNIGDPNANVGQAMEYAAGSVLNQKVLDVILREEKDNEIRAEATRFFCIYSRGDLMFLKNSGGSIDQASVQLITLRDSPVMASWWEMDKVLSYSSMDWSDWWVSRCHQLDQGCEMIKLMNDVGDILGVAYYERSVVDRHALGTEGQPTITLIRGIRLNPSINPEVQRRHVLFEGAHQASFESQYKGVASLLFYHILFASVRYGSRGVGVNCPKNEVAEKFYEGFMGPAHSFDYNTGRRYYRIGPGQRWKILQAAFQRQVDTWLEKREQGDDEEQEHQKQAATSTAKESSDKDAASTNGGESADSPAAKRRKTKLSVPSETV